MIVDTLADVGQEVIDVLVAAKKHEILLLSRKVRTAHEIARLSRLKVSSGCLR